MKLKNIIVKWYKYILKFCMYIIIIFFVLAGINLILQNVIAYELYPYLSIDYEREDLSEIIKKKIFEEEDYETLLLQTGYGKKVIDKFKKNGELTIETINKWQDKNFEKSNIENDKLLYNFTMEDYRVDNSGKVIHAPAMINVEEGDILLTLSTHTLGWRHGHAGIIVKYDDDFYVLESMSIGTNSKISPLKSWERYSNFIVMRVKDATSNAKTTVGKYSLENLVNKPYKLTSGIFGNKFEDINSKFFGMQCSYLVWYAWYANGYDLDSDGGKIVTIQDILKSSLLDIIQVYGINIKDMDVLNR